MALAGEGGLLAQLTKRLVESALEGELTGHLGYTCHDPAGRDGAFTHRRKADHVTARFDRAPRPPLDPQNFSSSVFARQRLVGTMNDVAFAQAGAHRP